MKKFRVKLTKYDNLLSLYERESGDVVDKEEDDYTILFSDGKGYIVKEKYIVPVNVKRMSLKEYKEIAKEGDWVRTNGDLHTVMENNFFIEGQVGEISKTLDENSQKEKETLFIWQNKYEGEYSKRKPIDKGFSFVWKVFLDNEEAIIELITAKEDTNKIRCSCCNKKEYIFDIREIKGKKLCISCIQKYFSFCSTCSTYITREKSKIHNNKIYCNICYKDSIKTCSKCEKEFDKKELIKSKTTEKLFCKECYENEFIICIGCKKELIKSDGRTYKKGLDNNCYCKTCFDERFGICADCERICFHDDLRQNEDTGRWYCRECWKKYTPIRDYGFSPVYQYLKLPWENKKLESDKSLYMGFELEIDTPEKEIPESVASRFEKFLKKEKLNKYLYFKHDSSIGGFEIISHPMTLQFIHKELKLKTWLSWLKSNNCMSYDKGDCGLHVHVNRKFFRILDIAKLRLFFENNWEQILTFSQRNGVNVQFCEKDSASINDILLHHPQNGRRWGLNLNTGNKETIEFRIFRGTLRHERFIATLQFIDALCSFVKEVGITSLIENKINKNSWNKFLDWCQKTARYDHLCKLIKLGKLT